MKRPTRITLAAVVFGLGAAAAAATAQANMFNFMNPGKWFDNDDDDRWYGRRWGGPYGYGGGPYGYRGGPYGYGGGPYGYGGGPYGGWGGYPGYGPGSTIVVTPQSGGSQQSAPPRVPE